MSPSTCLNCPVPTDCAAAGISGIIQHMAGITCSVGVRCTVNLENPESFDSWIARMEEGEDQVTRAPIRLLRATLVNASASALPSEVPPLWHWLYFLLGELRFNIRMHGHPKRGGFLPPVQLPRRMWAGGRLQFLEPLALGSQMRRVSVIKNIQSKTGRSGQLVFVTVQHEIFDE